MCTSQPMRTNFRVYNNPNERCKDNRQLEEGCGEEVGGEERGREGIQGVWCSMCTSQPVSMAWGSAITSSQVYTASDTPHASTQTGKSV